MFLKKNGKPAPPRPACSPFKIGTNVVRKNTNTICEVTQIKVNNLGRVEFVEFTALKKNENSVPEMSGSCRFEDFIKEFAW